MVILRTLRDVLSLLETSVTLGHVATSSTKYFSPSETPLQLRFKTTCLTPVDAILRSGRCAVAPTGLVLPWHRGRRTAAAGPLSGAHQRSRKSRTKSELLSLIGHSVQYLSF
jgi:hypothetical protein